MKDLLGNEIKTEEEKKEYLHQIVCLIEFLGNVTQTKIRDCNEHMSGGYTFNADEGHGIAFNMAINELKNFGELIGYPIEDQKPALKTCTTMAGGE